jgi:hypothetical protein
MIKPGDLVYYDRRGGSSRDFYPFIVDDVRAIGVVVAEIEVYEYQGEDILWTWILDENGQKIDISLDYLEPIII